MRLVRTAKNFLVSAWGAVLLARAIVRAMHEIGKNTTERVLHPMTAPSATPETNELIDGLFPVLISLRESISAESEAGTRVTLNELLHSVSDGRVRGTVTNLVEMIERLISGERPDILILVNGVLDALKDFIANMQKALADGFDVSDLLYGVSDQGLRENLKKAIDGIEKVPGELKGLDMFKMFNLFQRITAWLPRLLPST